MVYANNIATHRYTNVCMYIMYIMYLNYVLKIPLSLGDIDNDDHPVEVGLADAFYLTQRVFGGNTHAHVHACG